MNIVFVTVNFNRARDTGKLLSSFASQSDKDFDVIVVDNASTAADRADLDVVLSTSSLRPQIIWSDTNGGFAAGSNIGIRAALERGAQWVVLINNDTVTNPEFVKSLKRRLSEASPAVVALPLEERGRIVHAGLIHWLSARLSHVYEQPKPEQRIYAIGGGMAIHESVIRRIGFLDERYFLYFEDAAYSENARRHGVPILVTDVPAAIHEVSASTSSLGAPLLLRYHARNSLLFNRTFGPWWVRMLIPLWSAFVLKKQYAKMFLHIGDRQATQAIIAGVLDYWHGRFGSITP